MRTECGSRKQNYQLNLCHFEARWHWEKRQDLLAGTVLPATGWQSLTEKLNVCEEIKLIPSFLSSFGSVAFWNTWRGGKHNIALNQLNSFALFVFIIPTLLRNLLGSELQHWRKCWMQKSHILNINVGCRQLSVSSALWKTQNQCPLCHPCLFLWKKQLDN